MSGKNEKQRLKTITSPELKIQKDVKIVYLNLKGKINLKLFLKGEMIIIAEIVGDKMISVKSIFQFHHILSFFKSVKILGY